MRSEHVGTRSRVRDALHIGVEIPAKFLLAAIVIAAFNAGMIWFKFGELIESSKALQASVGETGTKVTRIEQHNSYQDEKLLDHETRIRTVERKQK